MNVLKITIEEKQRPDTQSSWQYLSGLIVIISQIFRFVNQDTFATLICLGKDTNYVKYSGLSVVYLKIPETSKSQIYLAIVFFCNSTELSSQLANRKY